jgi:hypothetical protein
LSQAVPAARHRGGILAAQQAQRVSSDSIGTNFLLATPSIAADVLAGR